jgi:hypothetical protein
MWERGQLKTIKEKKRETEKNERTSCNRKEKIVNNLNSFYRYECLFNFLVFPEQVQKTITELKSTPI